MGSRPLTTVITGVHWVGSGLLVLGLAATGWAQIPSPSAKAAQPARAIGVVSVVSPESISLRTDVGLQLTVFWERGTTILRVPPGEKDLRKTTSIDTTEIGVGDRVLVRGRLSEDQKSVLATSIIVMTKADIERKHEADRAEWRQRGIGGIVTAVNPDAREITLTRPLFPPTQGNLARSVTITLTSNSVLLRYAPDSVKFTDAKPSTFEEIRVGDQVRALGMKSEDGSRFQAEKLVSGAFRNIAATVTSIDSQNTAITIKDLSSEKPVLVQINQDSRLRKLSPFAAQMLAMSSSGGGTPAGVPPGVPPSGSGSEGVRPRGPAAAGGFEPGGFDPNTIRSGGPPDLQQMLERMPSFAMEELKPGEALLVVSTEGINPNKVTAIIVLAGVEPILAARARNGDQTMLGTWNLGMDGGLP